LSSFGRWQAKDRRLAVAFDSLSKSEVDTFRKSVALRQVEVPGKGSYENAVLEDIPIGPDSALDAQRWAMERFDRGFAAKPGYRSRAEVRERFAQATEETPLESFSPTLPSHGELLARSAKDSERYWSLAAPVDLAPFPVSDEELAALRIGSVAPAPLREQPGVVRIPYRGGWTMRHLVDRLLSGVAARRVLLCDRYVRGDDNLDALKLFVAALRAVTSTVVMDVWTGDEETDLKKVQSITGATPRTYRDVFGRDAPHDRYFLVLPVQGPGFGWHMTNTPLHARADLEGAGPEKPLRWKDLAATRVAADELGPALGQWIAGGRR
jgi:hypothetical protein